MNACSENCARRRFLLFYKAGLPEAKILVEERQREREAYRHIFYIYFLHSQDP